MTDNEQWKEIPIGEVTKHLIEQTKPKKRQAQPTPPSEDTRIHESELSDDSYRPKDYDEAIANEICRLVGNGRNLNRICKDTRFPFREYVYEWFKKEPSFHNRYTHARDTLRADYRFDSIDSVLKDMRSGLIDAQQARVMMDAIRWQAGKENPRRYGDKLTVEGMSTTNNTLAINMTTEQLSGQLQQLAVQQQLPNGVKLLANGNIEIDGDYTPVEPYNGKPK